jgi:hypothetical protein
MGLAALMQARTGPQRSMDVLSADEEERVDPSVPDTPIGGLGAGRPLELR